MQNAQKANLYYLQQTCPILIRSTLTLIWAAIPDAGAAQDLKYHSSGCIARIIGDSEQDRPEMKPYRSVIPRPQQFRCRTESRVGARERDRTHSSVNATMSR
eukprot:sb/3478374/